MCGIAGIAGEPDRSIAEAAVARMTRSLERRGPDAEGLHSWRAATFGHRRLAIFDLSDAGRQPMLSSDGAIGVVFNGAIYNFPRLRAELEGHGWAFRTLTDTEVLIHGYAQWGIDTLLSKLRGMFAIGLWDAGARKLFLARDRLGVKPLVYCEKDGAIAFASTARAVQLSGFPSGIDTAAVAEFLEYGYVTDKRCIYSGARKLPAGCVLEWQEGRSRIREYWTPPEPAVKGPSFTDAVVHTEELLLQAVERRLFADVPVGALLSAGVDSSLVCWAIARLGGCITAFTVSTPGDESDESAAAGATARQLGIAHEILPSTDAEPEEIETLVAAYGEPFACSSALGMLKVSQAVKRHATVLLTGDGGDDVFLGYPEHRYFLYAERLARRIPRTAAALWPMVRRYVPRRGVARRAVHFLDYATAGLGGVVRAVDGLPYYAEQGLLGDALAGASVAFRSIPLSFDSARRLTHDFLAFDRGNRFVGEYMTKVDGGAMHYALEARSPFLDQELWEFASSLPVELRLHRGQLKAILRELARRHIGEQVAIGKKRGFTIPVGRWMAGRWRPAVESALVNSLAEQHGWIRAGAVRRELAAAAQTGVVPKQLWYIYVLERWLRYERKHASESAPLHPATV